MDKTHVDAKLNTGIHGRGGRGCRNCRLGERDLGYSNIC